MLITLATGSLNNMAVSWQLALATRLSTPSPAFSYAVQVKLLYLLYQNLPAKDGEILNCDSCAVSAS